jgi:hypothetical protein
MLRLMEVARHDDNDVRIVRGGEVSSPNLVQAFSCVYGRVIESKNMYHGVKF